jgi:hypothetical protein
MITPTNEKPKGLMNDQIAGGADLVGNVEALKGAAENVNHDAPQIADPRRGGAERFEGFSHDLRDQSVDDLFLSIYAPAAGHVVRSGGLGPVRCLPVLEERAVR